MAWITPILSVAVIGFHTLPAFFSITAVDSKYVSSMAKKEELGFTFISIGKSVIGFRGNI